MRRWIIAAAASAYVGTAISNTDARAQAGSFSSAEPAIQLIEPPGQVTDAELWERVQLAVARVRAFSDARACVAGREDPWHALNNAANAALQAFLESTDDQYWRGYVAGTTAEAMFAAGRLNSAAAPQQRPQACADALRVALQLLSDMAGHR